MSGSGNDTLVLVPCLPPETPSRPSASQTVVLTMRVVIVTWCKSECSRCWLAGRSSTVQCTMVTPKRLCGLSKIFGGADGQWIRPSQPASQPARQAENPGAECGRNLRLSKFGLVKVVSSEASHGELGLTAVTCHYQGRKPPALACAASGG